MALVNYHTYMVINASVVIPAAAAQEEVYCVVGLTTVFVIVVFASVMKTGKERRVQMNVLNRILLVWMRLV